MTGPAASVAPASTSNRRLYWRRVRWLTAALLLAWLLVSLAVVFNARQLNFVFFGWPFSFWWAAQGALLVFLAMVALFAWVMSRLDARYDVDEQD